MTNINKITTVEDVLSHNEVLEFLKQYLRYGYVKEAQTRLKRKALKYSNGDIRNIKNGIVTDWKVLEILAEMARENQMAKKRVEKLIINQ